MAKLGTFSEHTVVAEASVIGRRRSAPRPCRARVVWRGHRLGPAVERAAPGRRHRGRGGHRRDWHQRRPRGAHGRRPAGDRCGPDRVQAREGHGARGHAHVHLDGGSGPRSHGDDLGPDGRPGDHDAGRLKESAHGANELCGKGGTMVVTGIAPITQTEASINLFQLAMRQKEIKGTIFGSLNPRADIPRLLDLYRPGSSSWTSSSPAVLAGRDQRGVPAHAGRHQHPWRHRLRTEPLLDRLGRHVVGRRRAARAGGAPPRGGTSCSRPARHGQVDVAAGRGGRARHRLRVRGGERRADAGPARRTLRPGPGDDRRVHPGRLRGRTTRVRAPRRLAALRRGDQPHPGGDAQRPHHRDERGRAPRTATRSCRRPPVPARRGDEPFDAVGTARISSAYDRTCRLLVDYQDAREEGAIVDRAVGDGVDEEWREKLVDLVRRTRTHPEVRIGSSVGERSTPPRSRPASRSCGDCRSPTPAWASTLR